MEKQKKYKGGASSDGEVFYRVRVKINLGKTYVTIFGREYNKPKFIDELRLKWCNSFKLLGIHFDVTLSNMQKKPSK